MAARSARRMQHLRPRTGDEQPATYLELFFDLVYVFAVTQLSLRLGAHLDVAGFGRTAFLLAVVWWAWIYTTWMANWFDPESVAVRAVLLVVMLASLLMSISLPEAFGSRAVLFAGSYVGLQVVRNAFDVWATDGNHLFHVVFQRLLAWSLFTGVFWIAGGLASGHARVAIWLVALGLDYAAPFAGYWTPGLGRSATTDWDIEGSHFSERFQLFIIIALGESIVETGAAAGQGALDAARVTALVLAFAASAALWWLYFDEVAAHARRRLRAADDAGRLARDAYTYLHMPIVAGIILSAVGDALVIEHPSTATSAAGLVTIVGGPALYLLGHNLFRLRMIGSISPKRLAATVALVAAGVALSAMPALVPLAATVVILGALAVSELHDRLAVAAR